MAIPIMNAGADVTLAYSTISGGPTTQALTGGATVTAPGTVISTWLWTLLEKPAGSSAALSSTSAQNPTLNSVDTVGTYRIFLQGTDDGAQVAISDPLKAPSSAFVTVTVTTQFAAIPKPAPGQRNWHDEYWTAVDGIDANKNTVDTHIADVTDPHNTLSNTGAVSVSNAPSAGQVLTAVSGVSANWAAAGAATSAVATLGIIECAETPFSAPNPKAVTRDKVCYGPTKCLGTLKSGGFTPWEAGVPAAVTGVATTPSPYSIVWYVPFAFTLVDVVATIEDSGVTGNTTVEIRSLSTVNYLSNDAGTLLGTVTLAAATGGAPAVHVLALGTSIPGGRWIGALVTGSPTTPGGGLSIQLNGYQEF